MLCGAICGKKLDCNNPEHVCKELCHSGLCRKCYVPPSCQCGATKYKADVDCSTVLPKCFAVCNKVLSCGHKCMALCSSHNGSCPPCELLASTRLCRCGNVSKALPCDVEFLCKTRCNKLKTCGRHKCSKSCCSGCEICREICGNKLACGNCRCEALCHAGPCEACPKQKQISCACGRTSIRVKCGMENQIDPPRCKSPCSYVVCHHLPNHSCHFGPCKPCGKKKKRKKKCLISFRFF